MTRKTAKSNNDFRALFIIVIILCLIGIFISFSLFYNNFFRSLSKQNEEPVATITFKYKTAQRKFLGKVVWDRLRQNSPVYNGDIIHTSALSEATLWFSDGTSMELSENTMAQVFVTDDGQLSADLDSGFAFVDTTESENDVKLSVKGTDVVLSKGAAASVASKGENASVQVEKGETTVSYSDGKTQKVSEGSEASLDTADAKPKISVTKPLASERILYHTKGKANVHFQWTNTNENDKKVMISLFSDKNYTKEIEHYSSFASEIEFPMSEGTYYWKVASSNDEKMGKLKITQSLPPSLVVPAENYSFDYRKREPPVRFIWTESPQAASYKLEIAKNKNFSDVIIDMRTSSTSAIVSTLSEGNYFWRVTPFYSINKIGFASPSETKKFVIEKKGNLSMPTLLVPQNNGMVDTENDAKKQSFSWRAESEASEYLIRFSDAENMNNVRYERRTQDNYAVVDVAKELGDGKWYWAVSQVDEEGNLSPFSKSRSFIAMKGKLEQHTTEPPDGYKCSVSLLPDTKFVWVTNLPSNFESTLQIASDASFKNVVYSQNVTATSMRGINLSLGKYHWRLKSTGNGFDFTTPAKTLTIVDNLQATRVISPSAPKVAVTEFLPCTIKWSEVQNADYYKVTIFNAGRMIFEDVVYGTELEIDMYKSRIFKDRIRYNYQIQAFSNAIDGVQSRISGKLAEGTFLLYKLHPVEITSPRKNAKINGIDAIINPPLLKWTADDDLSRAQMVLTKVDGRKPVVVMKYPTDKELRRKNRLAPKSIRLDVPPDGLQEGKYEVTIFAETVDGIDVSNTNKKNIGTFTVLPVERLPKPSSLSASPEKFDISYLEVGNTKKAVLLSWQKTSGATNYILNVKNKAGKNVVSEEIRANNYEISFEKQALPNDTYTWTVSAIRRIVNKNGKLGKIIQRGIVASSSFVINIPKPEKSEAKGATNLYAE